MFKLHEFNREVELRDLPFYLWPAEARQQALSENPLA
jgi:hypothetical protein